MDFDPQKDYYKSLGITENATEDEIKKAFRKLAVKHHPDKGGDKKAFQEINEAHQTLSDSKKRSQYDMYRKGGGGMGGMGGFGGGFGGFGGGGVEFDLSDVMGDLFGGQGRGGRGGGAKAGEDVQLGLSVSFDDAYNGTEKTIKYSRKVSSKDTTSESCPTCKGRGVVNQQAQTVFGVMQVQGACSTCKGIGQLFTKNGKRVAGGLETISEELTVKIPAGVKDGVHIKYRERGDQGIGTSHTGDLYIQIQIKPSDTYTRKGEDLYVTAPVSIFDLVLGQEVSVPHPSGAVSVKIPKGAQITDKIRVSKKGFGDKGLFSSAGDMYVIPKVQLPKKLTKDQEELWEKLAKIG